MIMETLQLNPERGVTLTAYLQSVGGEFGNIPKRPAVLILPGGAYMLCSDREADPVAMPYLKAGYQVFILRYSVGKNAVWPNPLEDYEQAMTLLRSREDWNLLPDKIAVVGFSAGGHLAGAAATMAKNRPNAAILGYPAVGAGTIQLCLPSAPDVPSAVDRNTCPCFVFGTRDDTIVAVKNLLDFTVALDRHGISFESHIYAYGPHGYSTGDSSVVAPNTQLCDRAPRWAEDSIAWLRDMLGDFGEGAMTEPRCPRRVHDNGGDRLSIDCTTGYLLEHGAKALIGPMLDALTSKHDFGTVDLTGFLLDMRLRDALSLIKAGPEVIMGLEAQLSELAPQE